MVVEPPSILWMTENPEAWEAMVVVGRIARAHGNRGQVVVNLETDFPEDRFQAGRLVYVNSDGRPRPCRIAGVRFQAGRPVLALDGVETMSQAEALAQQELRVPEATLALLPEGTYYQHDLLGCEVTTTTGTVVGTVVGVRGTVGVNRLVVRPVERREKNDGFGRDDDEIEVPLAEAICVSVDPARRVIVIDPPDGLLELNRRS